MKNFTTYLLAIIMCISLCACGSSTTSDNTETEEKKITTSSEAIYEVKNHYPDASMFSLENQIAGELHFKSYYDPKYGSEEAKENPDGSWTVTLKGNMSGYTDEYGRDLSTRNFTVNATVTADGDVEMEIE